MADQNQLVNHGQADQNQLGNQAQAATPILYIPKHWEYFLLSVMLALMLPLLPLFMELFATGDIKPDSMAIAIAMYAVGIGVTSRSQVVFGACLLTGIIFAVAYGVAVKNPSVAPSERVCWATIGSVFVVHGVERFQRHVQQRSPFLEFKN
jgi:hypothetical protein